MVIFVQCFILFPLFQELDDSSWRQKKLEPLVQVYYTLMFENYQKSCLKNLQMFFRHIYIATISVLQQDISWFWKNESGFSMKIHFCYESPEFNFQPTENDAQNWKIIY